MKGKVLTGLSGELPVTGKKGSSGKRGGGDKEAAERDTGEGNGNPLQDSCLENPTDRGAWRTTVHGVAGPGETEERDTEEIKQQGYKGPQLTLRKRPLTFYSPPSCCLLGSIWKQYLLRRQFYDPEHI